MLFFLTFYVFKRVLATYIERKRLEEAVTVHEKKHETKSRGFSRDGKKTQRGAIKNTPSDSGSRGRNPGDTCRDCGSRGRNPGDTCRD